MTRLNTLCALLAIAAPGIVALDAGEPGVNATVDFSNLIRDWDGFGVNYNAVIPWAAVQTLTWVGGDPNPGTALRVSADGDLDVLAGCWFYKQASRAGQPGMAVVPVTTTSGSGVEPIGFASNGTRNPDVFVVLNTVRWGFQPMLRAQLWAPPDTHAA